MYYSYATFFLLVYITIKDTKLGTIVSRAPWLSVLVLFVVVLILALAIGYIDKRYIRPHEMVELTNINPLMRKLLNDVDSIKKKVHEDHNADQG